MLDTLDLDNHAPLVPVHVEVNPAVSAVANDLSIRLRKPTAPAKHGEIELAHRTHPVGRSEDDPKQQPATLVSPNPRSRLPHLLNADQALVDRHQHQQAGLPIRTCPQGGQDGGHRNRRTRQSQIDAILWK